MAEDTRQLAAMLVPVTDDLLLVPGTVVAEIIPWQEPETVHSKPGWFLGNISWRGLTIPAVSFERITENTLSERVEETRLAIINGVGGNSQLPFYALVVQGIPRTVKLTAADISDRTESIGTSVLGRPVKASGASATVPNLDGLEEALLAS